MTYMKKSRKYESCPQCDYSEMKVVTIQKKEVYYSNGEKTSIDKLSTQITEKTLECINCSYSKELPIIRKSV